MGSGVSKDEEVYDPGEFSRHVKSEVALSGGRKSSAEMSQQTRKQRVSLSDKPGPSDRHGSRVSRVEGYEVPVVHITKDGFTENETTVMEGQVVTFEWDETCSPVMSVFQVVHDGETLKPVVGGFAGSPTDSHREFEQLFSLEGEYKFAIKSIRCTPLTVRVTARIDLQADLTDLGFVPDIIHINQGHSVCWSWKSCDVPHTVNEVTYLLDKACFYRQQGKNQSLVATVAGKHRQQFKTPGTFYFRTESSQLGRYHLCVVIVRPAAREHRIEVLDRTFKPLILLVEEGDRVWWHWDKTKCQKLHHIYQIKAPEDDHKQESPYELVVDGFGWHQNPSNQGLMCHQFRQAGVYYYSDQSYDEAASYMGTIIVKTKPKQHQVEIKGKAFSPAVVYAQTGDQIVWSWNGAAALKAGEQCLLLEENKLLNSDSESQPAGPVDDKLQLTIDEDAIQRITQAGTATTTLTSTGLYTYRLSEGGAGACCGSVLVNPGPKNHTIHLTDAGMEPKVIRIKPNDRIWWVWQNGQKQHSIQQVSHEGATIQGGFSSGLPRDCPSAFQHQFLSPGVFYFESKGLPKMYGAIFVSTQPQVHIVTVGKVIKPHPVTVQLLDIICWVFKQPVRQGVVEVTSVDAILDATFSDVPVSARLCLGQIVRKLGLTHYYSKAFQKEGKHTKVSEEVKLSSAVCDERTDFSIIRVTNQNGFRPKEIYLEKGKTVMWTWRGDSGEKHNIIHVMDPSSETPLNPISGAKAFNSGKPLENNCFIYTFDEAGDYSVVSQGAPGFSCVVHIRDEVLQTSEPYNVSDKQSGTVERYYRLDLGCDTEEADIYYTTDGSVPALHLYNIIHYKKDKGVVLKQPGLCFVRAIAVKSGQVCSHVFTSSLYWVLSGEDNEEISEDENTSIVPEDDKKDSPAWDWWNCRPHIKGCVTGPGTINIFWDLPAAESARQLIKGYKLFLNGVSYCPMFPMTNHSLHIQGLAGGGDYVGVVHVYPKDKQYVEIISNNLHLTCPMETETSGPVISVVQSDQPDSLTIVWMSISKDESPMDGYLVFLNGQQCGQKLVPDPESKRCKVVISNCELNIKYKIYVQALLKDSRERTVSNVLEVELPLDTSHFQYPADQDQKKDEDIYREYIQVSEGAGYLPAMDDPDNLIWESETDTSSAISGEDGPRKKKRRRKKKHKIPGTEGETILADGTDTDVIPVPVGGLLKNGDQQVLFYDAGRDEVKPVRNDGSKKRSVDEDEGSQSGGSDSRKNGPVLIEVEKSVVIDGLGSRKATNTNQQQTSLDQMVMVRVGEGEYVSGSMEGLLPAASIMAESQGKEAMMVSWKMGSPQDPEYKLQLFVVNVVGAGFSSDIASDISFECKFVEKDGPVQGVQHCWNIEFDPKLSQHSCHVKGLLPEVTYRVYTVANYVMMKGQQPCEAQTTSAVLYYTIQGPLPPPKLWISKLDLYSACLQWEGPETDNGQKLNGYLIFINGKELGNRHGLDVREMIVENLVPGKTLSIFIKAVSDFGDQEGQPSRTLHITCPQRPPAPVICQEPSFKQGCVLISWNKPPAAQSYTSSREAISHYSVYIDDKWYGEVRANKLCDQQGYQYYLTDLLSEQGYDISVKAVAGERSLDPHGQHVYCLSESLESNIVPVMAPSAPRSPKIRLEGLHADGIDVTWLVPQQCGEAVISGYQMLRNGKLYGSVIPPDVTSLRIRDVTLGEKIELQLIALTEHAVGKVEKKADTDRDSGKGSSQQDDKESSPSHKAHTSNACLIEFKGVEELIDYSNWPTVLKDVFAGERYTGCKPGPKLIIHYTGLVSAPSEVWCEKVTGHSALIVWKKVKDSKAHFVPADSYQVTWWPGDRAEDNIQSDSTTDDHLLITNLKTSTMYTVVVEARKIEKYKDFDEGAYMAETPDGMNAFILSSKSKQLPIKTASPPEAPANVGVVAVTCHSFRVGWDPLREHGSEIIGIRLECLSLDPIKQQLVTVDTLPDCTLAELSGLNEKTDYRIKVIAVTDEYFESLPENHAYKHARSFPQDMPVSEEESPWLPSSSIIAKTGGTDPASKLRTIKATTTSLTLSWSPPLVYGSNKLTGQVIRWSDVKKSRQAGHEDVHLASHVSLLPTEDTYTLGELSAGAQYKICVEAVVSVKTTLEPDSWDSSNVERYRRTTHMPSAPLYARTRAPIEPPKVAVVAYTQTSAVLCWEKPTLMSVVGKDKDGHPQYLRRYLQGYKLEINGKLQQNLGPEIQSCTLTKCKPGQTYSIVLVAMTMCTQEVHRSRKIEETSHLSSSGQEVDSLNLLLNGDQLDESPSEPVEVTLPKNQDGYLKTLEAKYRQQQDKSKVHGDIELVWSVQGKTSLLKQFNIVWYSMDDRVIQTKIVGPDQRNTTIPVTRLKTVYMIKVEPSYYTDVLAQHAQELQVLVPGPPDAPQIFLKSRDVDEFTIEWGQPKLYGGVAVRGYQVYLNEKKVGQELSAAHNKATVPCKPNRTYRVYVVAVSDKPEFGDSPKSNILVISTFGHSEPLVDIDDDLNEDTGIPVATSRVTENSIHLDWSRFLDTRLVAFYKVQWNSIAQPESREVKLSEKDTSCIITKCLPGTTHFLRLVAYGSDGQVLDKSRQLTIQTSAAPDPPRVSLRASNFRYISVQWERPTTYGDALISGYKVYVNGVVEAALSGDQLNYTHTQGTPCQEYAFQVQALTADDHLSSKPSEPLVVTWPGSRPAVVKRLPSGSSSSLRVGWEDPYLTEGLKVKHYMVCCKMEGKDALIQRVGPLHADAREAEFKNLKMGDYSVHLETYLYGSDTVIRSEPIRMQPTACPDPPQIVVTLIGLEDRREIEKITCDLVNRRDRLIRQVGHQLKKIGALSHPLKAEKNEEIVNGAVSLTQIEELLEDCFSVLDNYTGQLTALVSWQCPQSDPVTQVSGYKLLVDGKQYGNVMHAGMKTVRVQLGLDQPSYHLAMVAVSSKPQGESAESNSLEVLSSTFKPFTFYCYHTVHRKDAQYPAYGCCKYQDSILSERQSARKLANQGLLQKQIPAPACHLLDVFDGKFKPLLSSNTSGCPTVIFFWTPWCLSSQKTMDHYIKYARNNSRELTYLAVACGTSVSGRKSLAHIITTNSWREHHVWHATSHSTTGPRSEQEETTEKPINLADVLGIAGVPTLLFLSQDGNIIWHGRYCAFDYPGFENFMRHTLSEVTKRPCPVPSCDCCRNETSVDDATSQQVKKMASSQPSSHTLVPYSAWSSRSTKHPPLSGCTHSSHRISGTRSNWQAGSSRHQDKFSLSVSRRPYSASNLAEKLEKSPYTTCVAPHLHKPHKIKPRPMSAKIVHYYSHQDKYNS